MKSWKEFEKDGAKYSPSEEYGLSFINNSHKRIFSIGISTAGFAEIRMALSNSTRNILATTLDKNGLEFTKKLISKHNLNKRIELKIQDISKKQSFEEKFDFVYARLVLHYLSKTKLTYAISNINSSLNDDGELFVVVRSFDWESEVKDAIYDPDTELTTYPSYNSNNEIIKNNTRHLHSVGSIKNYLERGGFNTQEIKLFSETLYKDYERSAKNKNRLPANLIALKASKI